MKVQNACTAAKSSPSFHEQVNVKNCTEGECWETVLALSMSERPDDVFDMFETYRGELSSLAAIRSATSLEEHEDIEGSFEDRDERETPRDEKEDSKTIEVIQRLKSSDVMERIQLYPDAAEPEEGRSREPITSNDELLRKRLDDEIKKSRDLTRRLEDSENHRQQELINERAKVAALEAQLEEHQRTSNAELELEQQKSTHLEQKLEAVELHSLRNRAISKKLRKKLKELEIKHKEELSEYVLELNVQETTYGEHLDSAKKIMEFLQRKLEKSQVILLSKKAQVKTLECSNDSSQVLLNYERKKVKNLKLTESRNQYLLQAEQNKVKVLVQSISDLKSSIEKMPKKAMNFDGARDQIISPDSTFASIRQVVNGDANPTPKHETEKKDFFSYVRQYNALAEARSVRVDAMQNTDSCHPSSCVEPACETKVIFPGHTRQYNRIADDGLMPVNSIQSTGTCQSYGFVNPSPSDRYSYAEPHSILRDE